MRRRIFSAQNSSSTEEPALNLTPLIDVVFVVLILFILIAPMLETDRVQLASAPSKDHKTAAQESSRIAIHVRQDNSIWIRSQNISLLNLASLLKQEKQKHPTEIPQLFQDKNASFGTYQAIKNAIETAGFEELDVILEPGSS